MAHLATIGFLVCPDESLIDDFVHRSEELDPDLVREVSRHLARCPTCREEADRQRRGLEAAGSRRPWLWALLASSILASVSLVFLIYEVEIQTPGESGLRDPGIPTGHRRDPRLAALARFDPPSSEVIALSLSDEPMPGVAAPMPPPLTSEDRRELAAASSRIDAGVFADAARLLEDLSGRHPARTGIRLLLAYALARTDETERALWHYTIADEQGAGVEACWGRANAALRIGDIATARRELSDHILPRVPENTAARELGRRLSAW